MQPRKRVRTKTPGVWLLEGHPLATKYLLQAVHGIISCHVVSLGQLSEYRAVKRKGVLLVDNDALASGVPAPLPKIQAAFAKTGILLLGKSITNDELLRLVLQGVRGFVNYDELPQQLAEAVLAVAGGHLWIRKEVLDKLAAQPGNAPSRAGNSMKFTPRERAILEMFENRPSNKEIATQMQISQRTVKFHLKNLLLKAGAQDRYSLHDMVKSGKLGGAA